MKNIIIQITLKDDMVSYQHLLNIKKLDSVRKNIELNRLIEAGFRALHGDNQMQPVVNSKVMQQPAIESQQQTGQAILSKSTQLSPTFPEVTGTAPVNTNDADISSTERSFILDVISSAEKN